MFSSSPHRCGLRRGELLALRWGDVDFEARHACMFMPRTDAGTVTETTKTEAGERAVPLFESARKALAARKLRVRFARDEDFVFCDGRGNAAQPAQLRAAGVQAGAQAGGPRGGLPLPRPASLRRFDADRAAS